MTYRKIQLSLSVLLATCSFHGVAQATELSSEKLYQLCSSFPYNSQCEGYTAPIALDDRPGEEGSCFWGPVEAEQGGNCKLVTQADGITAYIEMGDELSVLGDRRSTQEVTVPYSQMQQLQYREFKQSNNGGRAVNTLLFGAIGFFATRDKPVVEVTVEYQPTSATEGSIVPERLGLIFDRDTGASIRTHLEAKTDLTVGIPADELPSLETPEEQSEPITE